MSAVRPRAQQGRSLVAALLTTHPRCGFSATAAEAPPSWLADLDEAARQRPRLLGGSLVRLLARYVAADGPEAERCLHQAREDAAEYAALAAQLGLSPATAVEAFAICRAPILAAAQRWATDADGPGHDPSAHLDRVMRFFDDVLMSMLSALNRAEQPGRGLSATRQ